ncbi:DUF2225 domain-containing protein [Treponema zuelzerae]|uniref:DUF2225 domain-containing protein n=1 Tax=Teretinema zuelzerae TaxID=156 RepID=A0AAE3JIZ9_9SPIR|nr:DUF2225 domain-containing protein [Teretinema zuelzerae]MBN2810631.1 DUF2225 domain-containing protein [Spirochaetales bacterium]MCD1654898.1 DUF2225 domain-containing protein [Teretinema zuelzerae]
MASKDDKAPSITFYTKEQTQCPICNAKFKQEKVMSGGGRLIAGSLTDELRRLYEPSAKFGEVLPLVYAMTVCPKCLYAAFPQDFCVLDKESLNKIYDGMQDRFTSVKQLFSKIDYAGSRTLNEGAASYYLALLCYESVDTKYSPHIKQGLCALRGAWLFSDMGRKFPEENYSYIADLLYRKSLFYYRRAVELETSGQEMIANLKSFGPDLDKNYGFDGVLYLAALLEVKYGSRTDPEKRRELLAYHRRSLAKMFGLGRSSRNKPGPLLEHARNLYDSIVAEINEDAEDE